MWYCVAKEENKKEKKDKFYWYESVPDNLWVLKVNDKPTKFTILKSSDLAKNHVPFDVYIARNNYKEISTEKQLDKAKKIIEKKYK